MSFISITCTLLKVIRRQPPFTPSSTQNHLSPLLSKLMAPCQTKHRTYSFFTICRQQRVQACAKRIHTYFGGSMRSLRSYWLMALCVLTLLTATSIAASISVSPAKAAPADRVSIRGRGFGARESVTLIFDDSTIVSAKANSSGNFTISFALPASAASGEHVIHAISPSIGFADPATIKVNAKPARSIRS